ECQRLLGVEIEGVRRPQLEVGIGQAQRQHLVAARDLFRHAVPRREIDLRGVGELQAEAVRQFFDDLSVGRDLLRDDGGPQRTAGLRLRPQLLKALGRQALNRLGQPLVWEGVYGHAAASKVLPKAPESSIPYHRMSQKSRVTSNAT